MASGESVVGCHCWIIKSLLELEKMKALRGVAAAAATSVLTLIAWRLQASAFGIACMELVCSTRPIKN
jgi:hypothetical protein